MELKNYQRLFNAAADASKIDLDFVALQLMEKASSISNGELPEIEARLIRQKINYSVITKNEALVSIKEVLGRVTGYDLHHVVSEAFNIFTCPNGAPHFCITFNRPSKYILCLSKRCATFVYGQHAGRLEAGAGMVL